ncbi:MAG: hypothetical protein OQL19_18970 [Gammaproteobacteria bacterium]|nr:hypothetical protein [Gammaproteobacteria bacterium]
MKILNSTDDAKIIVSTISKKALGMCFGSLQLDFCQQLSQTLVTSSSIRQYSELVALGFWCRPAHLQQLKKDYLQNTHVYSARGLVFHITPGNVQSMFAYSWLLSLLMGNQNIVRLSSRGGEVLTILLEVIETILQQDEFSVLKQSNQFVQYDYDTNLTDFFSECCDIRVIWGGDQTIEKIRLSRISAKTRDVVFADRFSFALIDAYAILELNDVKKDELKKIANSFYKDVLLYGQQACSSPRLIVWNGKDKKIIERAKKVFWSCVNEFLMDENKSDDSSFPTAISNKIAHTQFFAMQGLSVILESAPNFYRIQLDDFKEVYQAHHCGEGLIFEMNISKLDKLSEITNKSFQTCSYYGVELQELRELVSQGVVHNILRFVPIGHALDFDSYWDGMDLFSEFSVITTFS